MPGKARAVLAKSVLRRSGACILDVNVVVLQNERKWYGDPDLHIDILVEQSFLFAFRVVSC